MNFRNEKIYDLDCLSFYTAPGLSWEAMLKITDIKLELITDIEIYNFIESGIRGGISQITHRYAEVNNKYLNHYDKNKEDSYIIYYDANALYSSAMSTYLPYKDFQWNNDEWSEKKILI